MASVSLSINVAQIEDFNPENIAVAASVPSAGDVQICVNTANVTSLKQIVLALKKFTAFIEDENYGPSNFKVL